MNKGVKLTSTICIQGNYFNHWATRRLIAILQHPISVQKVWSWTSEGAELLSWFYHVVYKQDLMVWNEVKADYFFYSFPSSMLSNLLDWNFYIFIQRFSPLKVCAPFAAFHSENDIKYPILRKLQKLQLLLVTVATEIVAYMKPKHTQLDVHNQTVERF